MLPNIIIVLGVALILLGGYMKYAVVREAAAPAATTGTGDTPLTEEVMPEEIGQRFEQWVADRLKHDVFHVVNWRSDKRSPQGVWAESNQHPDIEVDFYLGKEKKDQFALECKYRSKPWNGAVDLGKEYQLQNYRTYAKTKERQVFIVLGLGGEPDHPHELYIIPLDSLQRMSMAYDQLRPYKQTMKGQTFFYNKDLRLVSL